MQILDTEVPQEIQEAIQAIKPSYWLKRACSRYRRNSSLHLGLGIQRNISRKRRFMFARYSKILPELQAQLLTYIRTMAPNIQFTSIIINKFEVGDHMKEHVDGSLLPIHFCARFGQAVGAELCIGDDRYANGVFLTNTNLPHSVSECVAGTRFSIVTYIRLDSVVLVNAPTLNQLFAWGYPVESLALLHLLLAQIFQACLQNVSYKSLGNSV